MEYVLTRNPSWDYDNVCALECLLDALAVVREEAIDGGNG